LILVIFEKQLRRINPHEQGHEEEEEEEEEEATWLHLLY
jgi:hypothetical protein